DSAERIDDLDESQEVHLDEVVNGHACRVLHGLDHQPRAAEAEGRVDLVHPETWYPDPRVARQAHHLDVPVVRGDVNNHERVGVVAGRVTDVQNPLFVPG